MIHFLNQQKKVFDYLIKRGVSTRYGKQYNFRDIKNYSDFVEKVPMTTYKDLKSEIEQIKEGHSNILWPGTIDKFALSAGTTGQGKHIPLSEDRLQSDRRFMRKVILSYLSRYPDPGLFTGAHLSLPGTVELVKGKRNLYIGEISGFLAHLSPAYLKHFQIIPTEELSAMPWKEKFSHILEIALQKDLRVITAVPSWTLVLFQKALEMSHKQSIEEIWPNLKLIVSGGVALSSYKNLLSDLCGTLPVKFIENYGASEGYFAFNINSNESGMKLIGDNGIFYEWLPYSLENNENVKPVPSSEIERNKNYVLCISTNTGLWRYVMNDIIQFTQTNPPRLQVVGRVSDMIDFYGEGLYYNEAINVMDHITDKFDFNYDHLMIGHRFHPLSGKPVHYWFVITDYKSLNTINLSRHVDESLGQINRHYAIRRESDVLEKPEIICIEPTSYYDWLWQKKSTKAQTKLPHFINDPQIITELKQLNQQFT